MWSKVLLVVAVVVLLVAAGVALALVVGEQRWRSQSETLEGRLDAGVATAEVSSDVQALPIPVRRYLETVLPPGAAPIERARIEHVGTFDMGGGEPNWRPFRSVQEVRTHRPGFVWDARIAMAPGLTAFVHDAYVAGEGVLRAALAGLLTVMEQPASPELAQGEALRYLAETPWYPTALLPGQGVRWEAIDEAHALAILEDGETSVSLLFEFGPDGLVHSVRADERYREVDGMIVATPWLGRHWNYEWRDGVLVPLEGEVAWLLPDGPRPYWRGTVERIEFASAR